MQNNPNNPATVPMVANQEWAIDFMHDTLVSGRQIRLLNIIDPYNRECKGVFIRHNLPAIRVIELMERAIENTESHSLFAQIMARNLFPRHFKSGCIIAIKVGAKLKKGNRSRIALLNASIKQCAKTP